MIILYLTIMKKSTAIWNLTTNTLLYHEVLTSLLTAFFPYNRSYRWGSMMVRTCPSQGGGLLIGGDDAARRVARRPASLKSQRANRAHDLRAGPRQWCGSDTDQTASRPAGTSPSLPARRWPSPRCSLSRRFSAGRPRSERSAPTATATRRAAESECST